MRTTITTDKLIVYKYNYDKKTGSVTCVKCYAEEMPGRVSDKLTVIESSSRKHSTEITREDLGNIKKSFGSPIYLKERNDELAIKHFKWAAEMKIQEAKEEMTKYIEIKQSIKDIADIK